MYEGPGRIALGTPIGILFIGNEIIIVVTFIAETSDNRKDSNTTTTISVTSDRINIIVVASSTTTITELKDEPEFKERSNKNSSH